MTAASDLGSEFERSLDRILSTARETINLHTQSAIRVRDLDNIMAGLVVLLHAEVEGFIERLFTGYLVGSLRPANSRRVVPLIRARSYEHARAIVVGRSGDGDYPSWLPYSRTKDHAKRLFREGRPFVDLSPTTETALHHINRIRNAIAHDGHGAMEQFRRHCIGTRPLPSWQRRPAGYLRGLHSGGSTRFEYFILECRLGFVAVSRQ